MKASEHRPPYRWTNLVLSAGTLTAGALLAVGMILAVAAPERPTDPRQLDRLLESLVALRPWGWSMLGTLVLLATPALGLVATAVELRALQPRAALLAVVVLGVLGVAVLVAAA